MASMDMCTLTLRPYRPFGPPAFTYDIVLAPPVIGIGLANFPFFPVVNGISLNDNLGDITYTGQCTGTFIQIYPDPLYGGTPYEVTLTKDNGYLVLPCKVVNTASSIQTLRSTSSITTTGSTKLYEVKEGPPTVKEFKSQVPLTLEEMIKILKEEAN